MAYTNRCDEYSEEIDKLLYGFQNSRSQWTLKKEDSAINLDTYTAVANVLCGCVIQLKEIAKINDLRKMEAFYKSDKVETKKEEKALDCCIQRLKSLENRSKFFTSQEQDEKDNEELIYDKALESKE